MVKLEKIQKEVSFKGREYDGFDRSSDLLNLQELLNPISVVADDVTFNGKRCNGFCLEFREGAIVDEQMIQFIFTGEDGLFYAVNKDKEIFVIKK